MKLHFALLILSLILLQEMLQAQNFLHKQFVKKVCNSSIFLILMAIKKYIDLKSKTKYTSPKKISPPTNLPLVKLKTIKLNQTILLKTNSPTL